ncbi:hypothetical protein T440DRAFT_553259 [Plenodomus tracheiphilus IPT5]|uniref:C3H1-type domain-containing protein n=1 Tax=Plenodomus tracheiphilus IPT5 TaxID=1408161 RepID=A0A6A7BC63_9PLEO|nr:hypothetical protein T440DRAFT_553259 [Plenodomus tracheiphilus IPT5]
MTRQQTANGGPSTHHPRLRNFFHSTVIAKSSHNSEATAKDHRARESTMDDRDSPGSRRSSQLPERNSDNVRRHPAVQYHTLRDDADDDRALVPFEKPPRNHARKRPRMGTGDVVLYTGGQEKATGDFNEVAQFHHELASLKARIHDSELKMNKKDEKIHEKNKAINSLERRSVVKDQKLHESDREKDVLKEKIHDLEGTILHMGKEKHAHEREIDKYKELAVELNATILHCNEEILQTRNRAARENAGLKQRVESLQVQLITERSRIAYLEKQRTSTHVPDPPIANEQTYRHPSAPHERIYVPYWKPKRTPVGAEGKVKPKVYGSNAYWDLGLCRVHFATTGVCRNIHCEYRHDVLTSLERSYMDSLGEPGRDFLTRIDYLFRLKGLA